MGPCKARAFGLGGAAVGSLVLGAETQPIKKILVAQGRFIADEIASTATEEGCDFIVMGCEKKGRIAKTMGDNIVGSVIKRSSVPVLVIPYSK